MAELNYCPMDTAKARTPEDLERKYDLPKLKANQEHIENQIITTTTELDNFIDVVYPADKNNLQEQIDGKVETWFYTGIPSLSNLPASGWTTNAEKDKHIGDLYYDKSTGYAYIFTKENNVYSWNDKPDEKTILALATANAAQDTADSKRRTFTSQPTPPYDNGDLWIKPTPLGTTPETYEYSILGCQVAKAEGQSFDANDWRVGATDNTYATAIVDELGGTTTTILSGQVVTEMANYTKFTDLATGGSSIISGDNITTGSIKSTNYAESGGVTTAGTKIMLNDGTIKTKNVKISDTGVELSNGARFIDYDGVLTSIIVQGNIVSGRYNGATCILPFGINYFDYNKSDMMLFTFTIPKDFVPIKAYIILEHMPCVNWYYDDYGQLASYTGWARNLKLYKATDLTTAKMEISAFDEISDLNFNYQEIQNAFGANGYTGTNIGYTQKISEIDLTPHINYSSSDDTFNIWEIKSDISATLSDYMTKIGACAATLTIVGRTKYQS